MRDLEDLLEEYYEVEDLKAPWYEWAFVLVAVGWALYRAFTF